MCSRPIWPSAWCGAFSAAPRGRRRGIFPGRGFGAVLRGYLVSIRGGDRQAFLGHNPLGRLAVTLMVLLMAVILLHILFVVRAEVREGEGLVSAMCTGDKVLDRTPVDLG